MLFLLTVAPAGGPRTPRNLIVPKSWTNVIRNLWSKKWSHLSSRTQGRTDIMNYYLYHPTIGEASIANLA